MLRAARALGRLAGLCDGMAASCSGRSAPEGAAAVQRTGLWQRLSAAGQRGYAQTSLADQPGGGAAAAAVAALQQSIRSQPTTRRTGLVAVKVGMTQEWDAWGVRVPLSVLWVDDCQVVQVKLDQKEGYTALQLGCGAKRPKQLPGTLRGHFHAAGVPLKRKLAEFRVSPDALLPVGHELLASHFVAGQFVDVTGTGIGKGFQGVMKRWNFAGQPASHGNSLAHRAAGSTGGCQDPGKVFKGKKMPGRMGGKQVTVQNCQVFRVDPLRNLVYVRGQVPGHKGNFVLVRDSTKKTVEQQPPLPVPTLLDGVPEVTVAPRAAVDPYDYKE